MQAVAQAVVDAVTKVTGTVSGSGELCVCICDVCTAGVVTTACWRKCSALHTTAHCEDLQGPQEGPALGLEQSYGCDPS
jgi:hypothetical protein